MEDFQYGRKFQYNEYERKGTVGGITARLAWALLFYLLSFGLVRSTVKRLVYQPGQGPDPVQAKKSRFELQAVAVAEQDTPKPARAFGSLTYAGGSYHITALYLAQGAATILYNEDLVRSIGGGFVTPAILGQSLIDRARLDGVSLETRMV